MNRRNFLNLALPATGAILLSNTLMNQQAYAEISRQFTGGPDFDAYDVVIGGAGLSGYFAAIHAARNGKKVLITDRRATPGYDVAAKSKLWMEADGFDALPPELVELFLPAQEEQEIKNTKGAGPGKSRLGDEIALFKGSLRKGLLRNLLVNKVDVLLMTDVCGLLETKGQVTGVLLASKHGLHTVRCKSFVDASDNLLLSRRLSGQSLKMDRAGFVLELNKVNQPVRKEIPVPASWGLLQNRIQAHPGKLANNQLFLSFEFPVATADLDEVEHKARRLAVQIGTNLKSLGTDFEKAQIYQYAYETSVHLETTALPKLRLKGHYLLESGQEALSAARLQAIAKNAAGLVDSLVIPATTGTPEKLVLPGQEIALKEASLTPLQEPGFAIPLQNISLNWKAAVKVKKQTQVLVAGGGTAGALAAAGAIDKGVDTIVVDYFNDLGGTKTMGGVMGYYHGVRDNTFFKKQNEEAERIAFEANMHKKIGRKYYHLKAVLDKGGQFVTSAMLCGALTEGTKVTGVLICRHGQLEMVEAALTIDATGDGDVAAFAGAPYQIGDTRIGYTQNYSQWDVAGVGKLPSNTNRDYDIIDNTKISEQQRGLLISHYEAHFYDFHPFLTVRESRRIDAVHNLDLIDCVEGRHFEDVVALASSDFDPHNIGSSEFTKCGFLLPHSNDITVEVPYRSIVPKTLDGLLLAGRGYGQTHNALQFTRMTADLLVLGYLTGQIAADAAWKKVQPRQYDITALQKEWASLDYLPAKYLTLKPGDKRADTGEIRRRVQQLEGGAPEYLYECSRIEKSRIVPLLKERFSAADTPEGKLLLGKMLAWFGDGAGNDLIEEELKQLFAEEQQKGYPGGYIDDYDFIRGREKNMLEGLFWKINQNIGLLAMSGNGSACDTVQHILEHTAGGGGMVPRTNEYYDGRIDLKIIPFHNRILNLCLYAERVPDKALIPGFEKLLKDENVGGYVTTTYEKVRWRVFGGSLELGIAAGLARCGGKTGFHLLAAYLEDLHFNFKEFAVSELKELTGKDFGFTTKDWQNYLAKQQYPLAVKALQKDAEL